MNLFSNVLCRYLYGSTASAVGLQSGVTEFYLPCVRAGAPKQAGLWRISLFSINLLGYHPVATTSHDLQLAKPKWQRVFHARRACGVITVKFWLEAPWGWLLLYFAKWVSSCSFNSRKKLLVQWWSRVSSGACKNTVLIWPWLCVRKSLGALIHLCPDLLVRTALKYWPGTSVTSVLHWSSELAPSCQAQQGWREGMKEYKVSAKALLVLRGTLKQVTCQLSHRDCPPRAVSQGVLDQCSAHFPLPSCPPSPELVGYVGPQNTCWHQEKKLGKFLTEVDISLSFIYCGWTLWGLWAGSEVRAQAHGEAFGAVVHRPRCPASSDTFRAG